MEILRKNSFPLGLGIGVLTPLIGIGLVYFVFAFLVSQGWMDESMGGLQSKRLRTIILIGICANIYWIRKFNQPFTGNTLRGVMVATMLYAFGWFGMYYDALYEE